jgi:hypothetical protein
MLRLSGAVCLPRLTRFGEAVLRWDRIMCWVASVRGGPALLSPRKMRGRLAACSN